MNVKTPVTIKTLSNMLGMSERSINTYLKEVQEYCNQEHIPYVSKRGVGIYLNISKSDKKINSYITDNSYYYDDEYRKYYIKKILLEDWDGYSISLFAEELYTSKTSIINNLVDICNWFEKFNIKVIRKSKKGVYIEGNEFNKRCAITEYRKQLFDNYTEISNYDWRISEYHSRRLAYYYGDDMFSKICKCISSYEKINYRYFTDYSYTMLVEYICIQQQRINNNYLIDDNISNYNKGQCISEFTHFLENNLNIEFSYGEKYYIQTIFLGCEFQNYSVDYKCIREQEERLQANILTNETLSYLSQMLHLKLEYDGEIKKSIFHFLYHSLIRINNNLQIHNPFLDEIKKMYGNIFNICLSFEKYKFYTNVKPSEHEIGFLTLLISDYLAGMGDSINGILISSGNLFSSNMIRMKIEQKIPNIKIQSILSADFMTTVDNINCDIIITTLQNYKKTTNIPIVQITPLVSEKDVLSIERMWQTSTNKKLLKNQELSLLDYVKPEFIILDSNYISKENLIKSACGVLENKGYVSIDYYKEVLNRENISSTELDFGVAIPHGIENNIIKPAVLLIRLPKKMDWGSAPVDIIFLLALNFNDIGMTREFFKIFYDKVSNKDIIKQIRYAQNEQEILDIL